MYPWLFVLVLNLGYSPLYRHFCECRVLSFITYSIWQALISPLSLLLYARLPYVYFFHPLWMSLKTQHEQAYQIATFVVKP